MKTKLQYSFSKGEGLYFNRNNKHTLIANAWPQVIKRLEIQDNSLGILRHILKVKFVLEGNAEPEILLDIPEEELRSGKLQKRLPLEIISGDVSERTMVEHFVKIIRMQASELPVESVVHYKFGWNNLHYHWGVSGSDHLPIAEEYSAALQILHVLEGGNMVIAGVFLAAIHGPLKSVLIQAGIHHDFTTYIYGESALGKTELCRNLCNYVPPRDNILSLSSTRKELKKFIENKDDCTIIVDDFCKTASRGVQDRQLQSISELIQASCNSGKVLVDASSSETSYSTTHLVVTAESLVKNLSTINRCYFMQMQQSIPQNIWKEIMQLAENNTLFVFMQGMTRFIEKNPGIVPTLKQDFDDSQEIIEKQLKKSNFQINYRIIGTLAVQKVLKRLFVRYLYYLKLDKKKINRINAILDKNIDNCGFEMLSYLSELKKEEDHKKYLPYLHRLLSTATQHSGQNYLAENPEDYINWKKRGDIGRECLGIWHENGYISFSGNRICRQLAMYMKVDTVSKSILINELCHFGLLKISSDGRKSWKWNTPGRYYHVNFKELDRIINSFYYEILPINEQDFDDEIRLFNYKKYLKRVRKGKA